MGRCVKVDERSEQTEQARYIRVRVEIQLNKPSEGGGGISSTLKARHVGPIIGMNASLLFVFVVVFLAMRHDIAKLSK